MTALARLESLRRTLVFAVAARAALIGIAVAVAVLFAVRLLGPPYSLLLLAPLAGAIAAGISLLRLRPLRSLPRVALWVEERTPALRYALVTVAEGTHSPALDAQATSAPWWNDARTAALRSLVIPAIAALVVIGVTVWAPYASRLAAIGFGTSLGRAPARSTDVLALVRVAVVPPAYAGRPASTADDPTSIEALVGSAITVSGNGDATRLTAFTDSTPRAVAQRGDDWSVSLAMPARPGIIRLRSAAGRDRLIVLAPITDAIPAVTLLLPARDTIVRRGTGRIPLRAQLRDDIGLRDAAFEIVISSGGGENFTFRSATLARAVLGGRLEATLAMGLSLDSLQLKPGDILQMRAVARDANTVNGPGLGASETRALRVARGDEYDSVSVEALPPPENEAQVLSQRMLINLTEALVKKQRSLTRPQLVAESQKIAAEQKKLRKRVGDVVFQRLGADPLSEEGTDEAEVGKLTAEQLLAMADSLTGSNTGSVMDVEGDETPILAVNKPLLEAFNAMWDAGRALEVGEPAKALPPMRIALKAIQLARQAERIYLRGRPGTMIVDIAKARLAGKDKGTASVREPRPPVDPKVRRRSATFERVTTMLSSNPDAAADSLLIMRVDALGDSPTLAAALDDAAKALRKRDARAVELAWIRVRRTIGGEPVRSTGVGAWGGVP